MSVKTVPIEFGPPVFVEEVDVVRVVRISHPHDGLLGDLTSAVLVEEKVRRDHLRESRLVVVSTGVWTYGERERERVTTSRDPVARRTD